MNSQPETIPVVAMQTIVFEPTSAGSGSFWQGDNLLATLTVLRRAGRQGRLSLRDTNQALDIVSHTRQHHTSYKMIEDLEQIAVAERDVGEPSAALRYRGQEYLATRESLLRIQDYQPKVALALASNWNVKQMELRVDGEADLPLVAFFLFIAFDLAMP